MSQKNTAADRNSDTRAPDPVAIRHADLARVLDPRTRQARVSLSALRPILETQHQRLVNFLPSYVLLALANLTEAIDQWDADEHSALAAGDKFDA